MFNYVFRIYYVFFLFIILLPAFILHIFDLKLEYGLMDKNQAAFFEQSEGHYKFISSKTHEVGYKILL